MFRVIRYLCIETVASSYSRCSSSSVGSRNHGNCSRITLARSWQECGNARKIKTTHTEAQEAGETVVVSFTTAGEREVKNPPQNVLNGVEQRCALFEYP